MRSQTTTGKLWSVARYNSNNAWLYNGNNGKLNNNNLYNGLSSRALDYDIRDFAGLESFQKFADEMYDAYYICRSSKRGKTTQLEFEFNMARVFVPLIIDVFTQNYVPSPGIVFILLHPRLREVIAAWFGDRVVQTWLTERLKPALEKEWYDDDSFSCRVCKGGLRAAYRLRDLIYEVTNGYVYDAYVVKRDIRAFFMSIDTAVLEERMVDFIWQHFCDDEEERNRMCYLARVIYRSLPQDHCIVKGHPMSLGMIEPRKSLMGKTIGLPIGNKTSQDGANFYTTFYLNKLRELGYPFVHYTDDTALVVKEDGTSERKNYGQWRIDEKKIERFIADDLHIEWHPHKKYVQHFSKGVEYLGFKLRYDRVLPSDRIAHNFLWKTACAVKKTKAKHNYIYTHKESFMQTFNSYTGLLKWCDANRLKNKAFAMLKDSPFAEVYDFHGNNKVTIKPTKTRLSYFIHLNRERKRGMRMTA